MGDGSRRYRTKIEVLRDFLTATDRESRKSRIIGLANLNLVLFRRYLGLATSLDLVTAASGGYRLTPRARPALEAIERYLAKSEEAESALQDLRRVCEDGRGRDRSPSSPLPYDVVRGLGQASWSEIGRTELDPSLIGAPERSGGVRAMSRSSLPSDWWLDPSRARATPAPDAALDTAVGDRPVRPRALHRDRGRSGPKRE